MCIFDDIDNIKIKCENCHVREMCEAQSYSKIDKDIIAKIEWAVKTVKEYYEK